MQEKNKETFEMAKPWQVFAGDLSIVGAADRLSPKSPFEAPPSPWDDHGHHNYHLTVWQGTDGEYRNKLSGVKIALVGCMDWRFNRALYDEAVNKGYTPGEIMFFTQGGGVAQKPPERQEALGEILKGVYENARELKEIVTSGHVDRCGAWAYWLGAEAGKLPSEMGDEKGGATEISEMARHAIEGMTGLPKAPEGVLTSGLLLGVEEMDEEKHQLKIKKIQI